MDVRRKSIDVVLFMVVVSLLAIGIVMVFSASYASADALVGDRLYYLERQVIWAVLGTVAMLATLNVDYWRWRSSARMLLLLGVGLLVVVLVAGQTISGSQRWISVGPVNVQPSEAMKLAVVVFLAHTLTRDREVLGARFSALYPHLFILGLICGLILLQPDLGTAVAVAGTYFVMFFVVGVPLRNLALLVLGALPLLGGAIWLEPYRLQRFMSFLNPWEHPLAGGYHIIQSLYALGSGGLFGAGLGNSRQKLFYLPEQHTDFIFSVLGEELGLLGTVAVVALFLLFAWRGYRVAVMAPDAFGTLLAAGITSLITIQALVNIGVVTSTLPITGIPLPFISYGGSSLVFMLTGVGILLNVSKHSRV